MKKPKILNFMYPMPYNNLSTTQQDKILSRDVKTWTAQQEFKNKNLRETVPKYLL